MKKILKIIGGIILAFFAVAIVAPPVDPPTETKQPLVNQEKANIFDAVSEIETIFVDEETSTPTPTKVYIATPPTQPVKTPTPVIKTSTPRPTVADTPKPPTQSYICSYNAYNCPDLVTHSWAQTVYEGCGGINNDVHKLDRDKDGIACETLP